MITFSLLNILTVIAYVAFATDVFLEIRKVRLRKHSADVSVVGITIRTCAAFIIMWKLLMVGDNVLIFGHSIMVVLLCVYVAFVYRYKNAI